MFGHANYVTADHTHTRSSQITAIYDARILYFAQEFNFPGSYKLQELVRNAYHVNKLSWVTSIYSKQK